MLAQTEHGKTIVSLNCWTPARQVARWTLLGGILLVVLAACAALRTGTTGSSSPSNAIPWIAASGKLFSPVLAARLCRASDLRATVLGNGAYQGQVTEDMLLVDSATDACFLLGPPSLEVASPGKPPITVQRGGLANSRLDLQPGQQVETIIGCPNVAAGLASTSLVLNAPGGGTVTVDGIRLPADCSTPSIVAFQEGPLPAPTGIGALSVQLNLPASAPLGQAMSYTVTLVNPTPAAVPLTPCPSYTEHLSQPQGQTVSVVQSSYLLNCHAAASVPASGSLTFQMMMLVPGNWTPGPAKFLWNLEVQGQPAAGAVIEVS